MALFYITRDIERAAGLLGAREDLFVITNSSPLAVALQKKYTSSVLVVNGEGTLSTLDLMRNKGVQERIEHIAKDAQSDIIVFKNSRQIEQECEILGWRLLNPSAHLAEKIENKITQYAWLREEKNNSLEPLTPKSAVGTVGQFEYNHLQREFGNGFVLQYNIGHTGSGTKRIFGAHEWKNEVNKFSKRMVKVSEYIQGKSFTMNACIAGTRVLWGRASEQMTGISALTNNPCATVGNDWSSVSEDVHEKVKNIAIKIGEYMMQEGWKGLFGIDVIIPDGNSSHTAYLIEINARQPASASLEAQLQRARGDDVTIMDWHVVALVQNHAPYRSEAFGTGSKLPVGVRHDVGPYGAGKTQNYGVPSGQLNGSQVFFRNTEMSPVRLKQEIQPGRYILTGSGLHFVASATSILETEQEEVLAFSEGKDTFVPPGGELLRIQSKQGIVDTFHGNISDVVTKIRSNLR
ncbi:MAG: ATP-grasp domain-containing protein [Patescibacteria group bacterium]